MEGVEFHARPETLSAAAQFDIISRFHRDKIKTLAIISLIGHLYLSVFLTLSPRGFQLFLVLHPSMHAYHTTTPSPLTVSPSSSPPPPVHSLYLLIIPPIHTSPGRRTPSRGVAAPRWAQASPPPLPRNFQEGLETGAPVN